MDRKLILDAVTEALKAKGSRKFKQTMDLSINFHGIDFKKPENRLNIDIVLPEGRGKDVNVILFAESPQIKLDAENMGLEVYDTQGIEQLRDQGKKFKEIAQKSEFLAEPKFMSVVGKNLARVLGPMNKLPRPLIGAMDKAVVNAKKRIRLATRGKYLPVLHCPVGSEDMSAEEITHNIDAVLENLKKKVTEQNINSMYVKLTMGKPIKI